MTTGGRDSSRTLEIQVVRLRKRSESRQVVVARELRKPAEEKMENRGSREYFAHHSLECRKLGTPSNSSREQSVAVGRVELHERNERQCCKVAR